MMIAAVTQSVSTDKLPVNWFDAALLVTLGFGIFRGRKNGMTKEILPLLQWLTLVLGAGLAYMLVAVYFKQNGLSKFLSALLGYLSIAAVVFLFFTIIKKGINRRLEGSSIFGSAEYYLGMSSGLVRYACVIVFFLALLNARYYSPAEIAAKKAYNARWYGGGMYSGDYIPDLHTVQDAVFKDSFTGPYIKDYLAVLLIKSSPGDDGKGAEQEAPKKQPVIHIGN